jgi:hypothetical protein
MVRQPENVIGFLDLLWGPYLYGFQVFLQRLKNPAYPMDIALSLYKEGTVVSGEAGYIVPKQMHIVCIHGMDESYIFDLKHSFVQCDASIVCIHISADLDWNIYDFILPVLSTLQRS